MTPLPNLYPATPANVPESVTKASASFRRKVRIVMTSIILFFVVYLILITLAVALAIAAMYGGILLIGALRNFAGLMLGIGIIGLGIMVLFFQIKFIFAVSRFDRSGSIEIREEDQPTLFAFIRRITEDTQTPFPKRIYLSPDVNACVFYDSSFWSMFFPVKKNLQIGLGLVNALNLSEFKAVMAHEFGHFSQRSMKLGSFVYNTNRVIYNMLYENTSYSRSLARWASVSDYFALFAGITARIVRGIQYILQHMYTLINRNYMGLSREMEFHADAVAASVSGSHNCITALRRIELADSCYSAVMEKCNAYLKEKYMLTNLYECQVSVLQAYAQENKLTTQNNLPVLDEGFLNTLQHTRVNVKDQWASHPATSERIAHLESLNIESETSHENAWALFTNTGQWQQEMTAKIYSGIDNTVALQQLDSAAFTAKLNKEKEQLALPASYNGFYDNRPLSSLNIDQLVNEAAHADTSDAAFAHLFNPQNATLHRKIEALERDVAVLEAIANKQIASRSFDFDGSKYDASQANEVIEQLRAELNNLKDVLESLDKKAFCYFYARALQTNPGKAAELKNAYARHFQLEEEAAQFLEKANEMLGQLEPLFAGQQMTVEDAQAMVNRLKDAEGPFRSRLSNLIAQGIFKESNALEEKASHYLERDYAYFSGDSFFDNELNEMHSTATESWEVIRHYQFRQFKKLLELQLSVR